MNTNPNLGPNVSPRARIHPLVAGAAVAVILASATGIAAMTGVLPTTHASTISTTAQVDNTTPGVVRQDAHQPSDTQALARQEPVRHVHAAQTALAPRHAHASTYRGTTEPTALRQAAVDPNSGSVVAISPIQAPEPTTGIGAVGGAVAGGLLGNQIGQGRGRTLATIAGAIGGGLAGNGIEHEVRRSTTYQVQVRMADGSYRSFTYSTQPQLVVGERVHVDGDTLSAS
ncbi:MAG: glycine zipper 2TM domain-containing protein [Paraburkholderia sp.]|uniref:glycine zipper 2TM domain-containing protein n=1 Tax=Paraburkholderia sp. TaxID=1926495 RepID=UPI0011FA040B|nr:glycine zipper 2TM domain-containing protein [Paraburkholderia sp.]TAM05832.1 MAG: glycine zipper 2TM domain-containing protein [Paraburkholderia sp.]